MLLRDLIFEKDFVWPKMTSHNLRSFDLIHQYFNSRKPRRGGNQSPGVYKGRRMTYAELIMEAINSTPERRLTLRQIYDWMLA